MFFFNHRRLRSDVDTLREELNRLRSEVDTLKADREREVYVNEDGERVPMAQVINEYLYGAREGEE
jgi:hypothetical protein